METNKFLIDRITAGGIIYFLVKLKNLKKLAEFKCNNVNSPFRRDINPSCTVICDRSFNKWYFWDYGTRERLDIYSFAGRYYGLSPKTNFSEICKKIGHDLQIEKIPEVEITKFLNGEDNSISFQHLYSRSSFSTTTTSQLDTNRAVAEFSFEEIPMEKLSLGEKEWMKKYGITVEAMELCKAKFISSYTHYYFNGKRTVQKPFNEIWIVYDFGKYAKFYSPLPKRFQYFGQVPKQYYFGTPNIEWRFPGETIVLLVGGEKDVLTLISRGYHAMCLSSETKLVDRLTSKYWYFDCCYNVLVLYDNDTTGDQMGERLYREAGLPTIKLPNWVKEKGGKDISDFFALGGTKQELDEIIRSYTSNSCEAQNHEPLTKQKERLSIRTATQRLQDALLQQDIFPHFDVFFQKNELAILFGDTGKGKSIAAVSIANAISKGESFMGLENGYGPLKVLYYDFELTDKQFQKRYSNENGELYKFNDNIFIDNIHDISDLMPKERGQKFEETLIERIKCNVEETKAEVVVIDNMTFLTTQSAEDSQVALNLMRLLKELKTNKNISVLVLAHTPKKTSPYGITIQDLAGSKHIANFADSVFALGYSNNDSTLRYFIQVKPSRSGELKYDRSNVLVCEIEKQNNFLTLLPKGFAKENELLNPQPKEEKDIIERAKELHEQGKTYREIADILTVAGIKVSKSTVHRWLAS